jgi:hypothetical protein
MHRARVKQLSGEVQLMPGLLRSSWQLSIAIGGRPRTAIFETAGAAFKQPPAAYPHLR